MCRIFSTHHSSLITHYFFDFLFLLLLIVYILGGTASVPFHGDESTQIYMSRDYAYQFLQGDLDLVRYHDPPISATEQQLRLLNGTLNKYLIGFTWHLAGFNVSQVNDQWDWGGDWNYNQSYGHAPSDALLQVSRIPSALLLAAGVIVIFALGKALGGRPVAYLASLYYALNPALLINGRRAVMEGSLTMFSLLVVLAAIWLLQKRRWWTALALGIAAGLALASKHTAVFTLIAVFGACAVWPIVEWIIAKTRGAHRHAHLHLTPNPSPLRREGKRARIIWTYGLLIVAGVIALGVFYALNPAWWGDPVTRARQVFDLRADLLAGQTATFGGYANLSEALGGFFRQVFVNLPQYYEVPAWGNYIGDQIVRYESTLWRGISIGGSTAGGVILLILMLIGLAALVGRKRSETQSVRAAQQTGTQAASERSGTERQAVGTEKQAIRWLIGIWALAMLASTALLTPIEWQRYYLPAYPAVGLLAAYGLVWLIRRWRARSPVPAAPTSY